MIQYYEQELDKEKVFSATLEADNASLRNKLTETIAVMKAAAKQRETEHQTYELQVSTLLALYEQANLVKI